MIVFVKLAYITHNLLAPLMTLRLEVGQKLGQKTPDQVSGPRLEVDVSKYTPAQFH